MAHRDGSFARRLRYRIDALREQRDRWRTPIVPLHDVRRRLELLVMALYDAPVRIEAAPVVERRVRLGVRRADDAVAKTPPPGTLWLPAELAAPDGIDATIARYRALALDGAARILGAPRATAAHASDAPSAPDPRQAPTTTARSTEGEKHGVGEKDAAIQPEENEETTSARGRATDEVVQEDDPDAVAVEDAQGVADAPAPTLVQRDAAPASGALAIAAYDEWDTYAHAFRRECVTVRTYPAPESDDTWAKETLDAHRILVRRVRDEFERLRSRRERLFRQRDGDQLDINACIEALTQLRMGQAPDDRLYVLDRAGRRALAITILVDTSGSTRDPVGEGRPVIEIEKIALLLASEALDALGDRYALLTFSSQGAADVRVTTVKGFAEQGVTTVRSRIGAIAPGGNTRMGAAIRHAASLLVREPVGHRLLLVLSDGKPNDTDRYYEHYGVEDTRAAVLDARASGVSPFCLTVDANEPEAYVSHIFGESGHTILRRPDQLPSALLGAVKLMLGN
jgi:nitric oxide reductase NorD protein